MARRCGSARGRRQCCRRGGSAPPTGAGGRRGGVPAVSLHPRAPRPQRRVRPKRRPSCACRGWRSSRRRSSARDDAWCLGSARGPGRRTPSRRFSRPRSVRCRRVPPWVRRRSRASRGEVLPVRDVDREHDVEPAAPVTLDERQVERTHRRLGRGAAEQSGPRHRLVQDRGVRPGDPQLDRPQVVGLVRPRREGGEAHAEGARLDAARRNVVRSCPSSPPRSEARERKCGGRRSQHASGHPHCKPQPIAVGVGEAGQVGLPGDHCVGPEKRTPRFSRSAGAASTSPLTPKFSTTDLWIRAGTRLPSLRSIRLRTERFAFSALRVGHDAVAGNGQEHARPARRAPKPGKAVFDEATAHEPSQHPLDHRPQRVMLPSEADGPDSQQLLEVLLDQMVKR